VVVQRQSAVYQRHQRAVEDFSDRLLEALPPQMVH
jgi:hypothetical protein